ncbi:MAG TPA: APC family permease [Puia sp.]|nr:APC family permease [Puia sp.]
MSTPSSTAGKPSLQKVLGLSSLFVAAMGGVASQGSFVAILNGAGTGGASFFIALVLAGILMFSYTFSYLELSLMMPKAGGPGTYATVAIGHFPAIILVLGGYFAAAVFGAIVELTLVERVLDTIFPGLFSHIGLILLALLTILNLLGINIFSSVQNMIVYVLLIAAFLIGFTALNGDTAKGITPPFFWQQLIHTNGSVFSLTVLALWAFAGLEYVCPLLEEAKRPEKNLPKAMLIAAAMLIIVYGLIAFAGMRQVPAGVLATSEVPHWLLVHALFEKAGGLVIVVFAISTTSSTANAVIASIPRMLYGMAHHKQLPQIFKKIHPRWDTPWFGILFFFTLIAVPLIILGKEPGYIFVLIISATTLWLIAYIIAHINVMVLRKKYPAFKRPFKTPLFPFFQIVGVIGMCYAIWNNSPSPDMTTKIYLNTGIIIGIIALYAYFWVKFKMKKGLFSIEPIDEAITD